MRKGHGTAAVAPYKDAAVDVTLARLRAALRASGVQPRVVSQRKAPGGLYSLSVQMGPGIPHWTHGKGTSRKYALASGLAEMAERLQNQIIYHESEFEQSVYDAYGFMYDPRERVYAGCDAPPIHAAFKRATLVDGTDLFSLWEQQRSAAQPPRYPFVFVPFFDPQSGQEIFLPRSFLLSIYGSNGMAAGNTFAEAFTQGTSEIMERFALKQSYFHDAPLPDVDTAYLRQNAPTQYEIIRRLERTGRARILVKDASLSRGFPVVCVVVVFTRELRYTVRFGSHPLWQLALERCLTEAFQGVSLEHYPLSADIDLSDDDRPDHYRNFTSLVTCGKGTHPRALWELPSGADFKGFPDVHFSSQSDMAAHMLRLVRDAGYSLFIRDVSFMRFPAYQIIVPGMSETSVVLKDAQAETVLRFSPLDRIRSLDNASAEQLTELAQDIGLFVDRGMEDSYVSLQDYLSVRSVGFPGWKGMPLAVFLTLILLRVGRMEEARARISTYVRFVHRARPESLRTLAGGIELAHLGLIEAKCRLLRDYVTLRLRGGDMHALSKAYGSDVARECVRLFDDEKTALSSQCTWLVPQFMVPPCWDCDRCSARGACAYRRIKALHLGIKKCIRDNPVDQTRLGACFAGLPL